MPLAKPLAQTYDPHVRRAYSFGVVWLAIAVGCQPDSVSSAFGARCSDGRDCDLPATCRSSSLVTPGGMCTWACAVDADCPISAACALLDPAGPSSFCLYECRDDRDCEFLQTIAGDGTWTCRAVAAPAAGETRLVCVGQPP